MVSVDRDWLLSPPSTHTHISIFSGSYCMDHASPLRWASNIWLDLNI